MRTLDSGAKESFDQWPWFLPGGLHVLFLAQDSTRRRAKDRWGHADTCATSIDDPGLTRIVESFAGAQYAAGWLLSTEPRRLIAQRFDPERLSASGHAAPPPRSRGLRRLGPGFAVSPEVLVVDRPPPIRHQLVWMDRTGRTLGTVGPVATITAFALAPDERRVVASVTDGDSLSFDLWLFDAGREDGTRLTYQGRSLQPVWALDGRHIYFTGPRLELRTLTIGTMADEAAFENPGSFVLFSDVTRGWPVFRVHGRGEGNISRDLGSAYWLPGHTTGARARPVCRDTGARVAAQPLARLHVGLPRDEKSLCNHSTGQANGSKCRSEVASAPFGATTARSCTTKGPKESWRSRYAKVAGARSRHPGRSCFRSARKAGCWVRPTTWSVAAHGESSWVDTICRRQDDATCHSK